MQRRVLIVSPHFPPVNAPDHQRVRMSLPYLPENGWAAHVLAVDPAYVEGFKDPDLEQTVPTDVPVTRVRAWPARLTRWVGLGSLGLRAFGALKRAGNRILAAGGIDAIYLSTTVFPVMPLGPYWKRRFGVPFVLDLQDPWLGEYYERTGTRPPGGWLKYRVSQWLARRDEPIALEGAAQIICVSPSYPRDLLRRYPGLRPEKFSVLPFGGSEVDAELARQPRFGSKIFDPADGLQHWAYLGRGGADMATALRGLFLALQMVRRNRPDGLPVRLHFVGTNYAAGPSAKQTVAPVAQECGVADLVSEQTARVPYLEGLAFLQSSDVVVIIGSDDPGYSPSKIYPCILAGRPLLALVHEGSLAVEVIHRCRAGQVITFRAGQAAESLARDLLPKLTRLLETRRADTPGTDWAAFAAYTARAMTRQQCHVFDRAIGMAARAEGDLVTNPR
jgi:hypothetical protein